MTSLSDVKEAEIIEALNSKSRYLDDLLNIVKPYFESIFFLFAFIYFRRICFI